MRPKSSRWIWSGRSAELERATAQRSPGPRVERLEHRQVRVRENGDIDRESLPQILFDRSQPTARLAIGDLRRETTLDIEFSRPMSSRAYQPDRYRLIGIETTPDGEENDDGDVLDWIEDREIAVERVEQGPSTGGSGFRVRLYLEEPLPVGSFRLEIAGHDLTDQDGAAIGRTLILPFQVHLESALAASPTPAAEQEREPTVAALRRERIIRPRAALASLEIAYSRPMGSAAFLPSSYELIDDRDGQRIKIASVARAGECDCRLPLAEPLRDGRYRLTLNPRLKDCDGFPIQGRLAWRLQVIGAPAEGKPPRAVWDLPERVETPIREFELGFTQPMAASAFAIESYELAREDGRRVPLTGVIQIDSARARLIAAIPLIRGRFRLRIAEGVGDHAGQPLVGELGFGFEVAADRHAPRIALDWIDQNHDPEEFAVSAPITEIPLRFSRPMGDSAFSVDNYKIVRLDHGDDDDDANSGTEAQPPILIVAAASVSEDADRAELRLLTPLGPGRYALAVSSWIAGGDGVPLGNPGPIAITVEESDDDAEASAAAEFADGDWVSALDVFYSDGMTARTFIKPSHQLRDARGAAIPIAAAERVDANQSRLWIVPALEPGRAIELRIADSLVNLAGAPLADNEPIVCPIPALAFNSASDFAEFSPTDPYIPRQPPSSAPRAGARSVSTEEWKAALESVMKSAMQSARTHEARQSLNALSDDEKARAIDEAMDDLSIPSIAAFSELRRDDPSLARFDLGLGLDDDDSDEDGEETKAFPSIGGLMTASFASFEITFSAAMSGSAFDPGNYLIQTREGLPVFLLEAERLDPRTVKLRLGERLGNGRYRLFLSPDVTDARGESVGQPHSFEFEIDEQAAGAVHWIKPGDGDWSDPANWSEGRIPGPDDDVRIDGEHAGGASLTVTIAQTRAVVRSISAAEGLTIRDGSLTVRAHSECNRLIVSSQGELRAEGPTASLIVRGRATVQGGSLAAIDGALLTLPTVSTIDSSAHPGSTLTAEGSNSLLDLSGVLRIQGVFPLRIVAKDGGFVDLQSVRELIQAPTPGRKPSADPIASMGIRAIAEGAGSRIDFAALRVFRDRGFGRVSRIETKLGGIVHLDAMSRALGDFDPILEADRERRDESHGPEIRVDEAEADDEERITADQHLAALAEESARRLRVRIDPASDAFETPRSSANRRKIGRVPIGKSS